MQFCLKKRLLLLRPKSSKFYLLSANSTFNYVQRRFFSGDAFPASDSMHTVGRSKEETTGDDTVEGKETWSQFASRMRHSRRRIRTVDIAGRVGYEYSMLRRLCKKRPNMRQWAVRDDFCKMDLGVVFMSPAMQSAFMRVFRMKNKGEIRQALRDIIPVIMYRNDFTQLPEKHFKPEDMIPKGEAETLNQKKRELFERTDSVDKYTTRLFRDDKAQARLRVRIRQKLINFQRKVAVQNAVASRSVLYSANDAIGYLLFRGPPMYAALHRVFYELSKVLPHFVPKTMLDFGSGTGTAILVAKEVFDPASLNHPMYRNFRNAHHYNVSAEKHQLDELRYDLKRLQRNNDEKKKARFMAVSALLDNGEIDPEDLPKDLLKEIVAVSKGAAHAAELRRQKAASNKRQKDLVDGTEWEKEEEILSDVEDVDDVKAGEEEGVFGFSDDADHPSRNAAESNKSDVKTWWQRYIDDETNAAAAKEVKRLRPLQTITAVEPSPGMMEVAMIVLSEEAQDVQWKRYLMPEDLTETHDLVVAAFTISELATPQARKKAIKDLWRTTRGVLILMEHANLANFDMLMQARDIILEEKDVGMWDWQPTIIGPCPHEKACPIRFAATGAKHRRTRVCSVDADYRATFIDMWARKSKFKIGYESFSYLIIARNEMVPSRAEARRHTMEQQVRKDKAVRDRKQRELYEASLQLKDMTFERLSDEALHRPDGSNAVPKIPSIYDDEERAAASSAAKGVALTSGQLSSLSNPLPEKNAEGQDVASPMLPKDPIYVSAGSNRVNKLVIPRYLPIPTHRYNRNYVTGDFQATRPISPGEVITLRHESAALRKHFQKVSSQYYRIVRYPLKEKNKIIGTFCTPDGDLVTGRIYNRLYSKSGQFSSRWSYVGGYKLIGKGRAGDLFPHDVPVYGIKKFDLLQSPNTLIDVKKTPIALAAMRDDEPLNLEDLDPSQMTDQEYGAWNRRKSYMQEKQLAEETIHGILGIDPSTEEDRREVLAKVDADAEFASVDWARVVSAAKRSAAMHFRRQSEGAPMSKKKRIMMNNRNLRRGKRYD